MIERTLNRCADFAAISGVIRGVLVELRQSAPIACLSHGLNIRCSVGDLILSTPSSSHWKKHFRYGFRPLCARGVVHVYDDGNMIETHEQVGDFKDR